MFVFPYYMFTSLSSLFFFCFFFKRYFLDIFNERAMSSPEK